MGNKKPQPVVEVYFGRSEIYPENIPVRSLADTLSAVYRLAVRTEPGEEPESAAIRLLDVRRGSAVFRCVADDGVAMLDGLRRAGRWLDSGAGLEELDYALLPLRRLSEVASALDCPIVIRNPADRTDILARILPGTYDSVANRLLVTGDKTIAGRVERVGGATESKCALRTPNRTRLLHCKVPDEDVVRRLAEHLYQDVVVHGVATWLKRTWSIVTFEIREVQQPRIGVIAEAFEALRDAGGDAWDDIADPRRFIEEISGRR